MSDIKRRAQQLLGECLDDAADALKLSLKGTMKIERGSTRTVDARFVFAAALELDENEAEARDAQVGSMSIDDLAAARERLRAAKQAERKQA